MISYAYLYVGRFDGSILFVNAEKFIAELYKQTFHPSNLQQLTEETGSSRKTIKNNWLFNRGHAKSNTSANDQNIRTIATVDMTEDDSRVQPSNEHQSGLENQHADLGDVSTIEAYPNAIEQGSVRTIVLDCTHVCNIDSMGINALKKAWTSYKSVGIEVVIAGCRKELAGKLKAVGLVSGDKRSENGCDKTASTLKLYPTVHDAVVMSSLKHKS
jgi:anti-anti-sigma regulatory factor